ncbi:hypothetical protein [Legionella jordanis]|uniref:Lipase n=1 Tax=Legionella jordanis TaxID=456 RepID=A0A0W0VFJ8_9GAMM|nr:hypothetical protein [Legionella jordanis]KTD18900.1 hypothetical protein Ljor_0123 [Legionella jordanis]RMX05535.1 hypothetical protein EAW55_02465 [Legionella jordanis]RMX19220.1 hypothetical protein EAS68_07230 [Legionella jordanis]VEH13000.1 Uncharacterised protein [Legionella jordanis]HAT8714042.1 hypothetical protein [Legionella jordanis]
MDFKKLLSSLLIFFCTSCLFASSPTDNFGIVLIHGTNDHREDAYGGYWKIDFIDSLATTLPNPENHLVVACDFREYMWHEAAAGCVANQMLDFIQRRKISKITVYTHSNGANVIRWILSNPSYDARYLKLTKTIQQVIAIAPSSAGTPLADEAMNGNVFAEGVGWLLGYRNDSVKQQRVADMALFNAEMLFGTANRPSLPVLFRVVVGTDVTASPFSKASYCNGYILNAGLKLTQTYLASCSDGFLNCSSQIAAGKIWFYDWQKTIDRIPLSHNQSRYSCFGFEQILRTDLSAQGVA